MIDALESVGKQDSRRQSLKPWETQKQNHRYSLLMANTNDDQVIRRHKLYHSLGSQTRPVYTVLLSSSIWMFEDEKETTQCGMIQLDTITDINILPNNGFRLQTFIQDKTHTFYMPTDKNEQNNSVTDWVKDIAKYANLTLNSLNADRDSDDDPSSTVLVDEDATLMWNHSTQQKSWWKKIFCCCC